MPVLLADEIELKAIASTLPESDDDLIAYGWEVLLNYHESVMHKDEDSALRFLELREAIVWKLNGGNFFGSSCEGGGRKRLSEALAAPPGEAPYWGQDGIFVVEKKDIVAVVEYSDGFCSDHFSFNAIYNDKPFISETGYRSHFFVRDYGMTVKETAELVMESFLQKKDGRKMLDPKYWKPERQAKWPWLDLSETETKPVYVEANGQIAFSF